MSIWSKAPFTRQEIGGGEQVAGRRKIMSSLLNIMNIGCPLNIWIEILNGEFIIQLKIQSKLKMGEKSRKEVRRVK